MIETWLRGELYSHFLILLTSFWGHRKFMTMRMIKRTMLLWNHENPQIFLSALLLRPSKLIPSSGSTWGHASTPEVSDYCNLVTRVTAVNRKRTNSPMGIADAKTNIDIGPRCNDVIRAEVTSLRRFWPTNNLQLVQVDLHLNRSMHGGLDARIKLQIKNCASTRGILLRACINVRKLKKCYTSLPSYIEEEVIKRTEDHESESCANFMVNESPSLQVSRIEEKFCRMNDLRQGFTSCEMSQQ